ncbi:MAG: LPS assembly lipoprotein LptE [Bacteroidota bacterium]|nr:LPS assembly lipoprotein LptE [Bacteroidota bacterium]
MKNLLIFLFILLGLNSCGIYNFTGSSISPDIKTIQIENIVNEVGQGPPRMAQQFTERMKDFYQSNTSLRAVKSNGDLTFEGAFVGFALTPLAPTGQETGAKNRLTISIRVKFVNTKDSTQNINTTFSQYDDFDQGQSYTSQEERLIEEIFKKLELDIFQKTTANW